MLNCPRDLSTIHKFEVMGKKLLYDINSVSVFEIDDLTWQILDLAEECNPDEIVTRLSREFPQEEVKGALSELEQMEKEGQLFFSPERPLEHLRRISKEDQDSQEIRALSLQVSHECNLRCAYCFAGQGKYDRFAGEHGSSTGMMSEEVAERAIDMVLENLSSTQRISIGLFGGEPLMNFGVIKHAVEYGRRRCAEKGVSVQFGLTTNGTLLDGQRADFAINNLDSMIISLDGPPAEHNEFRKFANGRGSYDRVMRNIRSIMDAPIWKRTTIRGTFTNRNLDIAKRVFHFADQGFTEMSVEPAFLPEDDEYAIGDEHLPELDVQIQKLADLYVQRFRDGERIHYFHFQKFLERIALGHPHLSTCGAGVGYVAVAPNGDLYPCHHLDSTEGCCIGNVFEGINEKQRKLWVDTQLLACREECQQCWVRYLCGGPCRAHSIMHAGDFWRLLKIYCRFMECMARSTMWLYSEMEEEDLAALGIHVPTSAEQADHTLEDDTVSPIMVKG